MSVYTNHIERNLQLAGISVSMFAVVSGVPQATLSAGLRGRLPMSGETEARLHTLALRCADIAAAIRPLVFEKGNAESVKVLVNSSLSVEQIRGVIEQLFQTNSNTTEAAQASS
jgi:hypothetical protein